MGLLLTGRQVPADQAMAYGLVNEVVPRAQLGDAVGRWLDGILRCAPLSLRAIKQMVQRSEAMTATAAMRMRFPALITALTSRDSEEGVRAFQAKRQPVWQGE